MPGRAAPAASAALVVFWLATACGGPAGPSRQTVELAREARLLAPDRIEVGVLACDGEPELTALTQSRAEVRIQVTATVTDPADACLDTITVELDAPLGERTVVDATSGHRLRVDR